MARTTGGELIVFNEPAQRRQRDPLAYYAECSATAQHCRYMAVQRPEQREWWLALAARWQARANEGGGAIQAVNHERYSQPAREWDTLPHKHDGVLIVPHHLPNDTYASVVYETRLSVTTVRIRGEYVQEWQVAGILAQLADEARVNMKTHSIEEKAA